MGDNPNQKPCEKKVKKTNQIKQNYYMVEHLAKKKTSCITMVGSRIVLDTIKVGGIHIE